MATTQRAGKATYRFRAQERDAAIAELYRTEEKAELVDGALVIIDASGARPGLAAGAICVSLGGHERATKSGYAFGGNVGFLVDLPHRWSFSPDAGFYAGPLPPGLEFVDGPPSFAVEIRSENDYGPAAERAMRDKRADYLAAGTLAVWDVDLLAANPIRVYRDGNADVPAATYRRGEIAEAEPAVPGWRFSVDELFD